MLTQPYGCLSPDLMIGPGDMLIPIGFQCPIVIDYGPGGGGHGACMSDDFFRRYEPRYKQTLRKQKVKV